MEAHSPSPLFHLDVGDDPIVATALHDGHAVREEIARELNLTGKERRREEDPHTGFLTEVASTRIVACRSRFEVDLDRPRNSAVYRSPRQAWGLDLWKKEISDAAVARSLDQYDLFYGTVHSLLAFLLARYRRVVILDLHSYNHRREGPNAPTADPKNNPEIDVGTGSMDRRLWAPLVNRFVSDLRSFPFDGQPLDVRENVKFEGGHFACDVHETFSPFVCVLSVRIKKFYMDEWTGQAEQDQIEMVFQALESTLPGLREELRRTPSSPHAYSAGPTQSPASVIPEGRGSRGGHSDP